jgi:hypothetical protein
MQLSARNPVNETNATKWMQPIVYNQVIVCYAVAIGILIFASTISADADGGPRSRVRTAGHSAQPSIDVSGNFSAHVSAE